MAVLIPHHLLAHAVGTKTLFENLDLSIKTGDRVGLVGHNGSGKSTLLSILGGRREADAGDISRCHDLQLETVEQFISDDLQNQTLFDASLAKLPKEQRTSERYGVEHLLESLGFHAAEYRYRVGDLSGGQQNRLMFARAFITEPNLILFDEPTTIWICGHCWPLSYISGRSALLFSSFLMIASS